MLQEYSSTVEGIIKAHQVFIKANCVWARFGGEEFVAIFPDTNTEQGRKVRERLLELVPYGQTCSAGVVIRQPGDTEDTMMQRADQALYLAKDRGRDQIVCS